MSVVGIDLGNQNTVVAVAGQRSINVITNDVSKRYTPTMITLEKLSNGRLRRYLGEYSKDVEISKLPFTITQLKRIIMMAAGENLSMNKSDLDAFGKVAGFDMNSGSVDPTSTAVQQVAMFLGRIKKITQTALSSKVSDCVISVPGHWGDAHRRILLDAAAIAGLTPLLLMPEGTAASLSYGLSHIDSIAESLQLVVVDIGHSMTQVQLSILSPTGLTVVSRSHDASLGGRDIDSALACYLATRLETERPKVFAGLSASPKAMARLRTACEGSKMDLSASSKVPLFVESLFNDNDLSIPLTRQELVQVMEGEKFVERLKAVIAPVAAAVSADGPRLHVEVVGGSTRIPSLKEVILAAFSPHQISLGLTQDDIVARGCTYQCAKLSPSFKMRPFEVKEISSVPYAIKLVSKCASQQEELVPLLDIGVALPASRIITLSLRQLPMVLDVVSGNFTQSSYSIEFEKGGYDDAVVKVKARCSPSGIFSLEPKAAIWMRKETPEEGEAAVMVKTEHFATLEPILSSSLNKNEIDRLSALEASMAAADSALASALAAKNSVETFFYDMRTALSSSLAPFIEKKEEEDRLRSALTDADEWLESLPFSLDEEEGLSVTDVTMAAEKKLCLLRDSFSSILEQLHQYEAAEDQLVRTRREACRLGIDGGIFEPKAPHTSQVLEEVQRLSEAINKVQAEQASLHAEEMLKTAKQAEELSKQTEQAQDMSMDSAHDQRNQKQDIQMESIPASDLD